MMDSALDVIAINDTGGVKQASHLLKYDSTLGIFDADVNPVGDNAISVDGKVINIPQSHQHPGKVEVKAMWEVDRTVRSSALALGKLSALTTRIDPLVGDLLSALQASDIGIGEAILTALKGVIKHAAKKIFNLWFHMLQQTKKSGARANSKREHEKKVCCLGLTSLLSLPADQMPAAAFEGIFLRPFLTSLYASKEQLAEAAKGEEAEDEVEMDGFRSDDDDDESDREMADDDEDGDEADSLKLQKLAAKASAFRSNDDEDDSSDDDFCDDEELQSAIDEADPFVFFVDSVKGFCEDNIGAGWIGRQGIALALHSVADVLGTKDLPVVMTILISRTLGLIIGSAELREKAGLGCGGLIEVTSEQALKEFFIPITGGQVPMAS